MGNASDAGCSRVRPGVASWPAKTKSETNPSVSEISCIFVAVVSKRSRPEATFTMFKVITTHTKSETLLRVPIILIVQLNNQFCSIVMMYMWERGYWIRKERENKG